MALDHSDKRWFESMVDSKLSKLERTVGGLDSRITALEHAQARPQGILGGGALTDIFCMKGIGILK